MTKLLSALSTLALTACTIGSYPPAGPMEPAAGPAPIAAAPGPGPGGTGVAPAVAVRGSAECPNPEDHCLPGDDVFVGKKQWTKNWMYVKLGVQKSQPDGAGQASFFLRKDGAEMSSQWFYRTRAATATELKVGQLIVTFNNNKTQGIYTAPETRKKATGQAWFMARITSIAPVATGGYVLVTGGYKVSADAVRLIVGDQSKTTEVSGVEDAHYIKNHVFYVNGRLKKKGWQYVQLGAVITPPSPATKNEGQYMSTKDGSEFWTGNGWKTRPATQQDLQLGTRVFIFHNNKKQGVYQRPQDRQKAITATWFTSTVTDNSSAFKGIVTVAGGYEVAIDGIRVAVQ